MRSCYWSHELRRSSPIDTSYLANWFKYRRNRYVADNSAVYWSGPCSSLVSHNVKWRTFPIHCDVAYITASIYMLHDKKRRHSNATSFWAEQHPSGCTNLTFVGRNGALTTTANHQLSIGVFVCCDREEQRKEQVAFHVWHAIYVRNLCTASSVRICLIVEVDRSVAAVYASKSEKNFPIRNHIMRLQHFLCQINGLGSKTTWATNKM